MPWHTVAEGEWLQKIADNYRVYDWKSIYNHPENSSLKQQRPDPNLLHPGDRVFIPDLQPKELAAASDKLHTFVKKSQKLTLHLIVRDENEQPLASKPWKLELDGKKYSGTTDADGALKQDVPIPTSSEAGKLECEGYHYPVRLGHLNPIDEISGVKQRLANLGFDCGSTDESITPEFTEALK